MLRAEFDGQSKLSGSHVTGDGTPFYGRRLSSFHEHTTIQSRRAWASSGCFIPFHLLFFVFTVPLKCPWAEALGWPSLPPHNFREQCEEVSRHTRLAIRLSSFESLILWYHPTARSFKPGPVSQNLLPSSRRHRGPAQPNPMISA